MRAGMLINAVRMVAVRALPNAVPVRAAAARAITAQVNQAALALNTPDVI